jgi:hypothetical protein
MFLGAIASFVPCIYTKAIFLAFFSLIALKRYLLKRRILTLGDTQRKQPITLLAMPKNEG